MTKSENSFYEEILGVGLKKKPITDVIKKEWYLETRKKDQSNLSADIPTNITEKKCLLINFQNETVTSSVIQIHSFAPNLERPMT